MFRVPPTVRPLLPAMLLLCAGALTSPLAAGENSARHLAAESGQASPQARPLALPRGGSRAQPRASRGEFEALIQSKLSLAAIEDNWSENFDDINTLPGAGWVLNNLSQPQGSRGWFQGDAGIFSSHSGSDTSYIAADYQSTGLSGTISNWLISPEMALENGTTIRFWTRTVAKGIGFADRLQVRLSTAGGSTNVGSEATSVGDFSTLLLDINPDYQDDYPRDWTQYVLVVEGLSEPTSGRVAFRYFVENSGGQGTNGDYIGIDSFSVAQPQFNEIFSDRFEVNPR